MKKIFYLLFILSVLCTAQAFSAPSDNLGDPAGSVVNNLDPAAVTGAAETLGNAWFPIDLGRIMVFDNGNIDAVSYFKKVLIDSDTFITVFAFKSYNHIEEAIFFTDSLKVYQWKPGWKRLWYDFAASPGDKWKFEWVRFGEDGSDSTNNSSDAFDGASMIFVARDEKISVPYGEFDNCFHFRLERPGVADAAYIDEWFAKGVGCVMREWDSIAGPQQMKLVKVTGGDQNGDPIKANLRMDVTLDKEIYNSGEDVNIEVSVLNWTDNDITLNFNSSLQVDYVIDNIYRYSEHHEFAQALTKVVVPAHDVIKWNFIHKPSDYLLSPGKHVIQTELVGYELTSSASCAVLPAAKKLPSGLVMKLELEKDTVSPGEQINFTLTITNQSGAEQTLDIVTDTPLKYMVGKVFRYPGIYEALPATSSVVISDGGSVYWTDAVTADNIILMPGIYTFYAGLWGYEDWVSQALTVSKDVAYGTLSGTVYALEDTIVIVPEAKVVLRTVSPWKYLDAMSNMPVVEEQSWSTVSDAEGKFSFTQIPIGSFYLMDVYKEGYFPYQNTLRIVTSSETVKIILKDENTNNDKPLNYKNRDRDGIKVTIGTDASVYKPGSDYRAVFAILNKTDKIQTFYFDSSDLVSWSLSMPDGEPVALYTSTGGTFSIIGGQTGSGVPGNFGDMGNNMDNSKMTGLGAAALKSFAEGEPSSVQLTLESGQMVEFIWNGTFKDVIPDNGGKYVINAKLLSSSSTLTDIGPGNLEAYVKILVVPSESMRLEAQARNKEFVVDLVDSLKAFLDMNMKSDNITGQLRVSEVLQNKHNEWNKNRFVKMIEIDVDSAIRAGLDSCLVRIYYNKGDFQNPHNLVMAHWRDNISEGDGSADIDSTLWEELNTRIDTVNGYVEAYTTSFSSFGLFEKDVSTAIDDDKPITFALKQNIPNPFNPSTVIGFTIPKTSRVRLTVFNMLGQEVAVLVDGSLSAGNHTAVFNARGLSSGLYFYSIEAGKYRQVRKMTLLK